MNYLPEIDPKNVAAITVAEKCGSEPAGHHRAGGLGAHGSGKLVSVAGKREMGPVPGVVSGT
jgi:RimJ/RimL family protein N-acetyltransferase